MQVVLVRVPPGNILARSYKIGNRSALKYLRTVDHDLGIDYPSEVSFSRRCNSFLALYRNSARRSFWKKTSNSSLGEFVRIAFFL